MRNPFRYWTKRYAFVHKIKKICKQKGYGLVFHRDPMELRDGNDDERDFSVYTEDTVLSVKMIPANQKNAVLHILHKGEYYISDGTTLPQGRYLHHRRIQFSHPTPIRKMPEVAVKVPDSNGKKIRNVFMVHPACYEYQCFYPDGSGMTATSGDTFLGWELWCGRDFRKMLKSL